MKLYSKTTVATFIKMVMILYTYINKLKHTFHNVWEGNNVLTQKLKAICTFDVKFLITFDYTG